MELRPTISIRAKLTVIVGLFGAALAAGSLAVHAQLLKRDQILAAHEINSAHVKGLATNVESWLALTGEWARLLAGRGTDRAAIRRWLEGQTEVLAYSVYQPTEDARRWTPLVEVQSPAYTELAGDDQNEPARAHDQNPISFPQVLAHGSFGTISRVGGHPVFLLALPHRTLTSLATGGTEDNTVVVLDLRIDRLLKLVSNEISPGVSVNYLVDAAGHVIAHPDTERTANSSSMDDVPLVRAAMNGPAALQIQAFDWQGERWFGAAASLPVAGLIAVSQMPERQMLGSLGPMERKTALLALLSVTGAALVAFLFFREGVAKPAGAPEPIELAEEFHNLLNGIHQRIQQIQDEEPESPSRTKLEGLGQQAAWASEIYGRMRKVAALKSTVRSEART